LNDCAPCGCGPHAAMLSPPKRSTKLTQFHAVSGRHCGVFPLTHACVTFPTRQVGWRPPFAVAENLREADNLRSRRATCPLSSTVPPHPARPAVCAPLTTNFVRDSAYPDVMSQVDPVVVPPGSARRKRQSDCLRGTAVSHRHALSFRRRVSWRATQA
jgi:hypothetical protein